MRRRTFGGAVAALLTILLLVTAADARTTIRPRSRLDSFFFHGHYSTTPFDPADALGIQLWNCASGVMPTYIPNRESLVVCRDGTDAEPVLAQLVYTVELPGGSCKNRGRSCFFRDRSATDKTGGISYFRVMFSGGTHGNRVWLQSFGDLSAANQANMMLIITINGHSRASFEDTFTPLLHGGWYSVF